MEKLSKTLNNVYFGDYRLFANVARYDRFEKFDRINLGEGGGEKILRHEVRKYLRENGRNEVVSGISRKKKLERVKEEAVGSEKEKEKPIVVIGEGKVSKVIKERDDDLILSTKGKSKKTEGVEDVKGEVVTEDRSYEVASEYIEWECNSMVDRIQNGVSV